MNRYCWGLALAAGCLIQGAGALHADTIFVPNGSFESPATDFAAPWMDNWEKAPEPFWYEDPSGMFPWIATMGQFRNTTNGSPDHITNLEGSQGGYLFALPEVEIYQDYTTLTEVGGTTQRAFNAQFEAGKSYTLTVGVLGGNGGMTNGATLEIALYFRDAANNRVTVGATTITNTDELFPTNTYFTDYQVRVPLVEATDAWAGKRIGIRITSTIGFDQIPGGYWDVDNVRLTDSVVPNSSFESPVTDFGAPWMDNWEKAPEPGWYNDPSGMFPWIATMGQFRNTTNGSPDHITNMEGSQGAYLFALPEVAIFQDHVSVRGSSPVAGHELQATFHEGKAYALTVGVLGGGGGMTNGATLTLSLYYRDANSNRVTVASTIITNTPELFPTNTYFTDFQVNVPPVTTNDPWRGKAIGIQLASTLGYDLIPGGYWDVDHVRLTESPLANSSFELPATDFAGPQMDGWQKASEPFWYFDPSGMFPWVATMGQFLNTTNGAPNHIDNMDARQGAYLFALPQVAIFQEANWNNGANPDAAFQPGKSYVLTVGVLGGSGGMTNGATLELSLYYRDANSNQVTLAATTVTNTPERFPTNTHLTDFAVHLPAVKPGDPWAGKPIGVQLASTLGFDMVPGGYWDVDNVRLRAVEDPVLKNPVRSAGQFQFELHSAPGRYAVLTSTNLALPSNQWESLGMFTNVTGTLPVTDTNAVLEQRLYQVRPAP